MTQNKFFVSILVILWTGFSYGQTIKNSNLIIDFLGEAKYTELLSANPNYIYYLDVRCSSGFQILDFPEEKMHAMEVVDQIAFRVPITKESQGKDVISAEEFVALYESGNLNILKYLLSYHQTNVTYYVLGNTGKVLMLMPVEYINKTVNQNY